MSNDTAIKVEGVSKSFKLPHEKSGSIKNALLGWRNHKQRYENQHVLKNVSFEIKKGEFFGIVGRNGSGKSTLLKLISQIYSPDKGSITVNGKLTPFIELGVGFNPELSGRDNVYLNGALLGFNREEMDAMYGEIVGFAELERFMDQKLKNYSSGMQVRLAFSIAIRANTEVLILDEVLAVGDAAFQKKCQEYFEKLKREGRTVVLVTHDMASVERFCTKALLIEKGEIKSIGEPKDVARQYTLDNFEANASPDGKNSKTGLSTLISHICVVPKSKQVLTSQDNMEFNVEYTATSNSAVYVGISIFYKGAPIIEHSTIENPTTQANTRQSFGYRIQLDRFNSGEFTVTAAAFDAKTRELIGFTDDSSSATFVIDRSGPPKGGLLAERGEWVFNERAIKS